MQPFTVVFRFCGLSADGWYVLLTGLLCGCPMGAKRAQTFSRKGGSAPARQSFSSPSVITRVPCFSQVSFIPCLPLSYRFLCFVFAIYMPLLLLAIPAHFIYHAPFSPESIPENSGISQQHPTPNSANAFSSKHTRSDKSSSSALSLDAAILNSAEILVKIGGYLIFIPF